MISIAPANLREVAVATAPIRVVLADDSAAARTLVRYALSPAKGFDVVGEATNGSEALDLTSSYRPDCVVLDMEMPGTDGFEALAEIRLHHPSTPVIMLSGFSDEALVQRALAAGAVGVLNKTTQFNQLGVAIRKVTSPDVAGAATAPVRAASVSAPPADAAAGQGSDIRRLEYVISHDLSEPLRIITGFATLLKTRYGDQLDDTGRSFVEQIDSGAVRMQSMLDDLLSYSRAGRKTATLEPIDLGVLVTEVYRSLERLILERNVSATTGELPQVIGDPALLSEVLRQLVSNAIRFNRTDAPHVHISGHAEGRNGVVTVDDNGIGVKPAHGERVFDLFRRLNTREEFPGTGTGLALCRRLMDLQNGQIRLEGAPGGGTTVTLILPRTPNHEGALL